MASRTRSPESRALIRRDLLDWYAANARDLPWRASDATPWGILVSEIMLQQTPVTRVLPTYDAWLRRWPTPQSLAAADPGEAVRHWGRLGYPRRALRLHQAAVAITREHAGQVPADPATLRALPGIGEYTAAAVASFAFGHPGVVADVNVRRVIARLDEAVELPRTHLTVAERDRLAAWLPVQSTDSATAAGWSVAVMEFGALVCTARTPGCDGCPIAYACGWLQAGKPILAADAKPKPQAWHGTDRQCRGRILQRLRDASAPVTRAHLIADWPDPDRAATLLEQLVTERLAHKVDGGYSLTADRPSDLTDLRDEQRP